MARLIDADELLQALRKAHIYAVAQGNDMVSGLEEACGYVEESPTIDAEPVRHGRWEEEDERSAYKDFLVSCSECGAFLDERKTSHFRYCYNCGAKMDGGA